jgi:hypothetical protein
VGYSFIFLLIPIPAIFSMEEYSVLFLLVCTMLFFVTVYVEDLDEERRKQRERKKEKKKIS